MTRQFAPVTRDGEPFVNQIEHAIRDAIDTGVYRDGQALPGTRDLAVMFGVSDWTVTKATQRLAEAGVVDVVNRSRRIVRTPTTTPVNDLHVLLVAGSERSDLAHAFAEHTGWVVLDADTVTRPLVEVALSTNHADRFYRDTIRPVEYDTLLSTAVDNVKNSTSVIIAAPFNLEIYDADLYATVTDRFTCLDATVHLFFVWDEDTRPQDHPTVPYMPVANRATDPLLYDQIPNLLTTTAGRNHHG